MRIALVVEGTRGDVHPLLGLGNALHQAGCEVRVCAPPDFEAEAREHGFSFRPIGPSVRAFLEEHAGSVAGGGLKAVAAGDRYLRQALDWQFGELPNATADCDGIFAAGVQFSAASIAEHHGIPYRYVAYCPQLLPSREHPPFVIPVYSMPQWANRLAWWAVRGLFNATILRLLNRHRRRLGLAPARDVFRHFLRGGAILAADAELADVPRDGEFEIEQIPCLHPLEPERLPAKLEAFLEQGPAPVYIGFGSMTDPHPARTTRTILEAVDRVGCRALLSKGWAGLAEGPLPENVQAVDTVSHAALFPHVAAVVHHGGAGTTTTAARVGAPQILVPHLLDQFYWSQRVRLLGLGPPAIPRPRLSSGRLAVALVETLENEIVIERARDLGRRLRARAAEPIDVGRLLRRLQG
ncbi:MAG: glycosyltransferase [Proteobacteria bacterium]|nr:glycosyltransferase [Pseudomonadota bacterium]